MNSFSFCLLNRPGAVPHKELNLNACSWSCKLLNHATTLMLCVCVCMSYVYTHTQNERDGEKCVCMCIHFEWCDNMKTCCIDYISVFENLCKYIHTYIQKHT